MDCFFFMTVRLGFGTSNDTTDVLKNATITKHPAHRQKQFESKDATTSTAIVDRFGTQPSRPLDVQLLRHVVCHDDVSIGNNNFNANIGKNVTLCGFQALRKVQRVAFSYCAWISTCLRRPSPSSRIKLVLTASPQLL
jgi:hypothetical protein